MDLLTKSTETSSLETHHLLKNWETLERVSSHRPISAKSQILTSLWEKIKTSCSQARTQQERWGDYMETKPGTPNCGRLEPGETSTLKIPKLSSCLLCSPRLLSLTGQKLPGASTHFQEHPTTSCTGGPFGLCPLPTVSHRILNLRGVHGLLGALCSRLS